jgi:hypothetical protein
MNLNRFRHILDGNLPSPTKAKKTTLNNPKASAKSTSALAGSEALSTGAIRQSDNPID